MVEKLEAVNRAFREPAALPPYPDIGDRESDIYELFSTAHDVGAHFLVRTCVDRLACDGGHTIAQEMDEVQLR